MKLFSTQGNSRSRKILVAAELVNAKVEFVPITNEEVKKADYKKKNPLNKVPVLETADGHIFESNAILRYLARSNPEAKLYGSTLFEQGQVDQWLDFTSNEVDVLSYAILYPILGLYAVDADVQKKASSDLTEKFKILDLHLKERQYLVGTGVTIADLALASIINNFYVLGHNEKQRKSHPNLLKWFENISTHQAWVKQFGRTRYLKVPFPALKVEGGAAKPEQTEQKQEKKPAQKEQKEEKKKADPKDQPKKEPAAKKAVKPKSDEEEEEDDTTTKEKRVNPLDHLPPSTFNLDDYKRLFFATKDIAGVIQTLFDTVDTQGWSLWIIKYEKAEGEGVNLLKTTNTMRGFLQRIDPHFKKHSFGIWGVYGEEANYEMQGAWLWRGVEVPFEFVDHPSYEYHKFVKVDPKDVEQRQLWANYWVNQTEDESLVNGLTARVLQYWR